MILLIAAVSLISAWKWGDWKNWQKYHTTMIFVALANLLYLFLYCNHWLWKLSPSFVSYYVAEIIFSFIIFPSTALLFLSRYPKPVKKQIFFILKFIAVYFITEYIFDWFDIILYDYGWNIVWSLAWDCMMFPVWILHHKKPLRAYCVTLVTVILMLIIFPVGFR